MKLQGGIRNVAGVCSGSMGSSSARKLEMCTSDTRVKKQAKPSSQPCKAHFRTSIVSCSPHAARRHLCPACSGQLERLRTHPLLQLPLTRSSMIPEPNIKLGEYPHQTGHFTPVKCDSPCCRNGLQPGGGGQQGLQGGSGTAPAPSLPRSSPQRPQNSGKHPTSDGCAPSLSSYCFTVCADLCASHDYSA